MDLDGHPDDVPLYITHIAWPNKACKNPSESY